jgi:hypothetical protein
MNSQYIEQGHSYSTTIMLLLTYGVSSAVLVQGTEKHR